MPAEIVSHLVRRGVQAGVGCMKNLQSRPISGNPQNAMERLAEKLREPGALVTFAITAAFFILYSSAIEYSIRIVAINLASIEDTEPNGAIKLPLGLNNDDVKAPLMDEYDGEVEERAGQPAKPITSSLRDTFKHVTSIGGWSARWRGLRHGIFYSIVFSLFNALFTGLLSFLPVIGLVIARLGAAVLTCNLHAAWTHKTITMPGKMPFFQRFLPRQTAKKLILPTIRLHGGILAMQGATIGSLALAHRIIYHKGINWLTANAFVLPVVVFLTFAFLHVIPSQIALVRAEASLLPEDQSAIVPFDRTFGGRISWEFECRKAYVLQHLSLRGAYKTFDKSTYKRVVKMTLQMFAILTALTMFFGAVFGIELWAFAGKEIEDVAQDVAQLLHLNF